MKRIKQDSIARAIVPLLCIAVLIAGGTYGINHYRNRETAGATKYGTAKTACQLFTSKIANKLLVNSAQQTTLKTLPTSINNEEVKATTCSYKQTKQYTDSTALIASLTIQSPTSKDSVAAVKAAFDKAQKAADADDLKLYKAPTFWDKSAQLNMLYKNIWFVFVYGPTTQDTRSIAQTQQLADYFSPRFLP